MGSLHPSTEQKQQFRAVSRETDRMTQADRRYFERFPDRTHRVRLASRSEIRQNEILSGRSWDLPAGYCHYVTIRKIASDIRLRNFIIHFEDMETDVSEALAREIFDSWATEKTRQIEAQMRGALEKRT
jgi:hypothetical protein